MENRQVFDEMPQWDCHALSTRWHALVPLCRTLCLPDGLCHAPSCPGWLPELPVTSLPPTTPPCLVPSRPAVLARTRRAGRRASTRLPAAQAMPDLPFVSCRATRLHWPCPRWPDHAVHPKLRLAMLATRPPSRPALPHPCLLDKQARAQLAPSHTVPLALPSWPSEPRAGIGYKSHRQITIAMAANYPLSKFVVLKPPPSNSLHPMVPKSLASLGQDRNENRPPGCSDEALPSPRPPLLPHGARSWSYSPCSVFPGSSPRFASAIMSLYCP